MSVESLEFTGRERETGRELEVSTIWKCDKKPIVFTIPISQIDNIQMWVHEFSEYIIFEQIADIDDNLKNKTLRVLFNGAFGDAEIAHTLVSLHCISAFGERILTPEEFEYLLPWRTKYERNL